MINNLLFFVLLISLLGYVILIMMDELHMMQLNSYYNVRYAKWLKTNFISRYDFLKILIIISAILYSIYNIFFLQVILTFSSMLGIYFMTNKKAKKKLDFTSRAVTIFVVQLLLIIISVATIFFYTKSIHYSILPFVVSILFPFAIIFSANILTSPISSSINLWYINDAKKKLKGYDNLIRIGITGSYGKTSVKHFLYTILSEKYNVLITPGSYNTTLGVVKTIREALKPTHEIFIAEMGAKRIGDIKEICDIVKPNLSILTAIGPMHLETFGSIDNIKKAKLEIISCLPSNGIGFINSDDVMSEDLPKENRHKIISFGLHSNSVYKAVNIIYKGGGMSFDVEKNNKKEISVETRLLGEHNVINLLVCCSLALELNVEKFKIEKAIKTIKAVKHRLEVQEIGNGITVIDDAYNSNPIGSKMALEVLKRFEGKRKIIITPGMIELGEMEYSLNFEFGKSISKNCDIVVLVGKNRTKPIQEGIISSNFPINNMYICINLLEANKIVKEIMTPGDVILYENDLPDTFNK